MKKTIIYYKLKKKIKLNDGTVIETTDPLRFNFQEGPFLNVELHESNNIKRVFWVTEDQVVKSKTKRVENWSKNQIESHEKDLNEDWFTDSKNKK